MDIIALGIASKARKETAALAEVVQGLVGGLHYRGGVQTYADLPANPKIGDCYTVITTGLEYAWGKLSGTNQWIPIGANIPAPPATDGNYTLKLSVSNGVPTYTWVNNMALYSQNGNEVLLD